MKKYFGIIGAGGYGREVIPLAKAMISKLPASESLDLYFVVEGGGRRRGN